MNPFQLAKKTEKDSTPEADNRYVILILGAGNKLILESKTNKGNPETFYFSQLRTAEAFIKKVIKPALPPTYRVGTAKYVDHVGNTPLISDVSQLQ